MHRRGRRLGRRGGELTPLSLIFALALPAFACETYLERRQTFLDSNFVTTEDRVRVAFFDADHTLRASRKDPEGFVDTVDDVRILPGVVERLRELNARGILVAIVSNQGGVPKFRTLRQIDEVLVRTVEMLRESGAVVHYYDFAETWDEYRKPGIGMIHRLESALAGKFGRPVTVDRATSFMVGDAAYSTSQTRPDGTRGTDRSDSDRMFAVNAGLAFHEAKTYFGWGTQIAP